MPIARTRDSGYIAVPISVAEADTFRPFFLELLGYGLASIAALGADMLVLTTLVNHAGLNYLPASALAFMTGATIAYALSVRFVFRSRRLRNRGLEFGYFVGLGLAGLLVNSAVLFVAVGVAGASLVASKLLAAACTFATNFAARRQLLFRL
jgi:putative flippase GtrA